MEGFEGFVHPVVSHAVGPAVQAPTSLAQVARPFGHDHPNTGWASVEHHAFNHFFSPRPGPGDQDDVAVRKTVFGQSAAVLRLKHHDVLAKETPLGSGSQVKHGHSSEHQPLFCPGFPPFLNRLGLVVQFLANQFGHPCKMVLAASPPVRHRLVFRHWHFGRRGAVHPFHGPLSPHEPTTPSPLIIVWMVNEDFGERETRILKQRFCGGGMRWVGRVWTQEKGKGHHR